MEIVIDGENRSWTIKKMAKLVGVTDIVIIQELRKLGIVGVKPRDRIFYTDRDATRLFESFEKRNKPTP